MNLYAESSAIIAWLVGEPQGGRIRRLLTEADRIVTSSLTSVECARSLGRAHRDGRLSAAEELAALHLLDVALAGWHVHELSEPVLARASQQFPHEPVRTVDALHLATASRWQHVLGGLTVLSLDERIRTNATGLGLDVLPE